jgi:hypothetical protein
MLNKNIGHLAYGNWQIQTLLTHISHTQISGRGVGREGERVGGDRGGRGTLGGDVGGEGCARDTGGGGEEQGGGIRRGPLEIHQIAQTILWKNSFFYSKNIPRH